MGRLPELQWFTAKYNVDACVVVRNDCGLFRQACKGGHLEVVKWMKINYNLFPPHPSRSLDRSFIGACSHGHAHVAEWLANQEKTRLSRNKIKLLNKEHSLLDNAFSTGHLEVIKWLAEVKGLNIVHTRIKSRMYLCPFARACRDGHIVVVKWYAQRYAPLRPDIIIAGVIAAEGSETERHENVISFLRTLIESDAWGKLYVK
jgi:hypothetical protein